MKHLFESWRNHLNEAPIEQYDMLRKWMVENPDSYSFDNLFGGKISEGGKYRIPIPVTTGATSGPIGEIVRFFEDNGWEIDFRKGKVTKTYVPVDEHFNPKRIPSGPKQGDVREVTLSPTIVTELGRAAKLFKNYSRIREKRTTTKALMADLVGYEDCEEKCKGTQANAERFKTKEECERACRDDVRAMKEDTQKEKQLSLQIRNLYPSIFKYHSEEAVAARLPKLIEFFTTTEKGGSPPSVFYQKNPEAAYQKTSPYVIILSRHPFDVFRRSDMKGIDSCMGQGGQYQQCAIFEAQGHAPVAYLVLRDEFEDYFNVDLSKTDLSKVDVDAGVDTIFADINQAWSGIDPEGRLAIRKFVHSDGRQLAVPEQKTYMKDKKPTPSEFPNSIRAWALDQQRDTIGDPKKLLRSLDAQEWTRHGSTYGDALDGQIFGELVKNIVSPELYNDFGPTADQPTKEDLLGKKQGFSPEEIRIRKELTKGSYRDQANAILKRTETAFKHDEVFKLDFVMGGDNKGTAKFDFHVMITINLIADFGQPLLTGPKGDFPWDTINREHDGAVREIIDENLKDYFHNFNPTDSQLRYDDYWLHRLSHENKFESSMDGFKKFTDELLVVDKNWTKILNYIKEEFGEKGWIEPQPKFDINTIFETKSKTTKSSDKMLFESWKRYLIK